jgi:hypothetical protein
MRKIFLFIVIITSAKISDAQNVDQNVIVQLYTKTIENNFNETALSIKHNSVTKPNFLIIKDNLPENLPLDYKDFTIMIVNDQNDAIKQIFNANKKSGSVTLINREFKKDTIDISIGSWGISIKKVFKINHWRLITRQVLLSASCGGTIGYIPSGRMIYNKESKTWSYVSGKEVLAEMKKKNPRL